MQLKVLSLMIYYSIMSELNKVSKKTVLRGVDCNNSYSEIITIVVMCT